MSLTLYAHPFSSYCQKVLVALYENETPFVFRIVFDCIRPPAERHAPSVAEARPYRSIFPPGDPGRD
jgi:glutathione S-transferase